MAGIISACYATMIGRSRNRLTMEEKNELAKMVGDTSVVRQVLRGERIVRTVLKNPVAGTNFGELLEEPDSLIEFPAIPIFVAREKFVENRDGEAPIAYICGNSKDLLDIVEEGVPAVVLKRRNVLKRATDMQVLSAFGGEFEKARVAAAHAYSFLRDKASIFKCYTLLILGASGNPLSLHIWYDDGWHIEVLPVPYPRELEIGDYVVSP